MAHKKEKLEKKMSKCQNVREAIGHPSGQLSRGRSRPGLPTLYRLDGISAGQVAFQQFSNLPLYRDWYVLIKSLSPRASIFE